MNRSLLPSSLIYSPLAAHRIFADLVEQFVRELPERLAAMQSALEQEDGQALGRLAHQLKGAAGSYGFPALTDAVRQLESALAAQRPVDEIATTLHELHQVVQRIRPGQPE